ncbi:CBS domain-containing protein [Lacticaseibacillus paracasei]|nr:CBS domain-containing protein [Lacticaseibacillus paracasei]
MAVTQLTQRQNKIIQLLKAESPMTGETLATKLNISLATIRADLRLLTTIGILDARPKVGYAYQGENLLQMDSQKFFQTTIAAILLPPTEIKLTTSMEEAVTKLFLADVGSLYVLDDDGALVGLISRKDLLRASFTDRDTTLPASIVMTRMPNVITVTADTSIIAASKLLLKHNVDSLPVVQNAGDTHVIGKITKNRIFKYLIETLVP